MLSNISVIGTFWVLITGIVIGFVVSSLVFPHFPGSTDIRPHKEDITITITEPLKAEHPGEFFHEIKDNDLFKNLSTFTKVFCMVLTQPKNHESKARHVKATWGKRCNFLVFVSTEKDDSLPSIALNVTEERQYLRYKTSEALKYAYKHYLQKADWFLKADDDTYVIMENLKYILSSYSPSEPVYIGCKFKPFVRQGYMSGGAGYILSREALRLFVEEALDKKQRCFLNNGHYSEDVFVGQCMQSAGVYVGNSRDSRGRLRFFPFGVGFFYSLKTLPKWYKTYTDQLPKEGLECCSDSAVTFHYVGPKELYLHEYLFYHLRPFGIDYHYGIWNSTF